MTAEFHTLLCKSQKGKMHKRAPCTERKNTTESFSPKMFHKKWRTCKRFTDGFSVFSSPDSSQTLQLSLCDGQFRKIWFERKVSCPGNSFSITRTLVNRKIDEINSMNANVSAEGYVVWRHLQVLCGFLSRMLLQTLVFLVNMRSVIVWKDQAPCL